VIADFEQAGFANTAVESYAQPVHTHLAAFHDAMALRPQSKFRSCPSKSSPLACWHCGVM